VHRGEPGRRLCQIALGIVNRLARSEPPDEPHHASASRLEVHSSEHWGESPGDDDRHPDIHLVGCHRANESRRCHTDDRVRLTLQCDRRSDGTWVSSKPSLPEIVAHNDTVLYFRVGEDAAGDGPNAEHGEEVRGNEADPLATRA
jgi:hypothetical protein